MTSARTDAPRPTQTYSSVARFLHWGIAILIVGQLAGGWYMTHLSLDPDTQYRVFQLHKSFGVLVLIASVYRLYWRIRHRPPALPAGISEWQAKISAVTHWLLYGLMVAVPLAGWVLVSVSTLEIPTKLFFIIPMPHLPLPVSQTLEGIAAETHEYLALGMAALLVLHIGAALKHHLVDRDQVLFRMAPTSQRAGWQVGRVLIATYLFGMFAAFAIGFVLLSGDHSGHHEDDTSHAADATQSSSDAFTRQADENAWQILGEGTNVTLTGKAFGAERSVTLPSVQGEIILDPAAPQTTGRIDVTVDMTQMTGSGDTAETLKARAWFDVAEYPTARFTSDQIEASDSGAYLAQGTLTIKDTSLPIDLPFSLTTSEDGAGAMTAVAAAQLTVDRTDFGIGGSGTDIDPAVTVDLRVSAQQEAR